MLTALLLIVANGFADSSIAAPATRIVIEEEGTIQSMSKQFGISGFKAGNISDRKRIIDLSHDFSSNAQSKAINYFRTK